MTKTMKVSNNIAENITLKGVGVYYKSNEVGGISFAFFKEFIHPDFWNEIDRVSKEATQLAERMMIDMKRISKNDATNFLTDELNKTIDKIYANQGVDKHQPAPTWVQWKFDNKMFDFIRTAITLITLMIDLDILTDDDNNGLQYMYELDVAGVKNYDRFNWMNTANEPQVLNGTKLYGDFQKMENVKVIFADGTEGTMKFKPALRDSNVTEIHKL